MPGSREVAVIRVVVDTNVFARHDWMSQLSLLAHAGRIELYWSPYIVAEASWLLMWLWLRRHGRALTGADRRTHSDVAHRWFEFVTAVFRVVEDAPPHAPLWTDTPRDPNDRPIWTAAVRARAHVVVTENLRDGPPPDADGVRVWDNTLYVAPDDFIALLEWWDGAGGAEGDAAAGRTDAPSQGQDSEEPTALVRRLLSIIEARSGDEG